MPLTVRAWPDSTDPRGSHFSIVGYAFGMVPPNKFLLTTTDAIAPYDVLNDGVLVEEVFDDGTDTVYMDDTFAFILSKTGFPEIEAVPEDHTVLWDLEIEIVPDFQYNGDLFEEFPDAIQLRSISVAKVEPTTNKIPNPVTITPRNHLATS